ncbi:MAG: sugar phosphate isomerase/epimerase family protein [bacterium]
MEFGICCHPESAAQLKGTGCDFIETHVGNLLVPEAGEEDFLPKKELILNSPIPVSAANCFLPGHVRVTGPDYDPFQAKHYVERAFARANRAGVRTIVFGSGKSRTMPEGYDRSRAWAQLVDFGKICGPLAEARGITVVVEPLLRRACNMINTVSEGALLVRDVDQPNVRLLVDAFHFLGNDDSLDALVEVGPLLAHAHIATWPERLPPGQEDCDFAPFFRALKEGGYDGPISIEAKWPNMIDEAAEVLSHLRRVQENA